MLRSRFLLSTLLGASLLAAAPLVSAPLVSAQESAAPAGEDPVVAVVNGVELRQSDVLRSAQDLPPQMQAQVGQLFPALVQRLVDLTLLSQAASEAGLGDDERVKEIVARAQSDAVRQVYLEDKIDAAMTDERLQEAYDDYVAENPGGEEVKARHILLEKKEEAEKVIEELEGGADFETLAKEQSTGPSGQQGGDLGWFAKGDMVAPFSDAAFELQEGEYTKQPVETQFGWHVIKVEGRREKPAPGFEEVEGELRQQLARQVIDEEVEKLRSDAEIEVKTPEAPAEEAAPESEAPAE